MSATPLPSAGRAPSARTIVVEGLLLEGLVLALILLGGGLLRFWNVAEIPPAMWEDEAIHARWARSVGEGRNVSLLWAWLPNACGLSGPLHLQNEWILHYTGAVWDRLLPSDPPVSIRRASALWGTLTLLPLYFVVRLRYGRWPAALAAALFAVARWPVLASHVGFRANALPFFLLAILLTGLLATRRKSIGLALGCGALVGLSYYSYLPAKGIPLGILLWVILLRFTGARFSWTRAMAAACVAGYLLLLVPAGIQMTRERTVAPRRVAEVGIIRGAEDLGEVARNAVRVPLALFWNGDTNPRHNLPPDPRSATGKAGLEWWTGALFLMGVAAALRSRRDPVHVLLLLFAALMCLPSILTDEAPHFLRMAGLLAPVYVLVGAGVAAIGRVLGARTGASLRRLAPVGGVLLVAAAGSATVRHVLVEWPAREETYWSFSGPDYDAGVYVRDLKATTTFGVGERPYHSETFHLMVDSVPGAAEVYEGYVPDASWTISHPVILIAAKDTEVETVLRLYPSARRVKDFVSPLGGMVGAAFSVPREQVEARRTAATGPG